MPDRIDEEEPLRPLKGLFVLFEGIGSTIFESQVALHAAEMQEHSVNLEIWVLEGQSSRFPRSRANLRRAKLLAETEVRLFRGVRVRYPGSDIFNALILLYNWLRYRPEVDFIHARADWTAASCGLIFRWLGVPVIWDCRGHAEAEVVQAHSGSSWGDRMLKSAYLPIVRWRTRFAARSCASANFVSDLLQDRCGLGTEGKPTTVIPCLASSRLFAFSPEIRQETRRRLGYEDSDRVLVYSGGMASYQGFPDYLQLFKNIQSQDGCFKLLILSPELASDSELLSKLDPTTFKLHSATISEMNEFYNAADFGMLLRQDNAVNQVASPTKFAEFCLSGLPVIMNDSVRQAVELALRFGNHRAADAPVQTLTPCTDEERKNISLCAREELSREARSPQYQRLYREACHHVRNPQGTSARKM